MASYLDLAYINDNIILCACTNYFLITNIENIKNCQIIKFDFCLLIPIVRYENWIKVFQNFLSEEIFKDEALVNNECNILFKKDSQKLKIENDKTKQKFCFTKSDVKKFLYNFSMLFVHCLCLPDETKICFFELLLTLESINHDANQVVDNFAKKDFIKHFQVTINTFSLNVSAVHVYVCLFRYKKDFIKLTAMRKINKDDA